MPYFGVTPAAEFTSKDLDGKELILDADADTTITADTDDQIDIRIAGADDFQFTANTFTAQAGSTIAAVTLSASGNVDFNGDLDVDGTTNLDVVDIDGAVDMATTALVTGVLTTTAATVFNGGFASNAVSTITDGTSFSTGLTIANTGDTHGSVIDFFNNSSSPADNDYIGGLIFKTL